jgi:hypothetical protein
LGRGQLGETTRSNKAQEKIAWSELGLKARQERFNEWLGTKNIELEYRKFFHSSKIDWANVKLNKTQIMNEGLKLTSMRRWLRAQWLRLRHRLGLGSGIRA